MSEWRLFDPENPPEWLDSDWWRDTPNCNHWDNPVHQARLKAAAETARKAADLFVHHAGVPGQIVDLGAGDGGLLSLIPERYNARGVEVIRDSVRYANEVRQVNVSLGNVLRDPVYGDVAVCTEMLEHLEDPHGFVRHLHENTRFTYLVASSPHSETEEHHEWNHAWAWDREGYRALIEQGGWEVLEHFDAEWSQIILARRSP